MMGFEPTTPWTTTRCSNRLSYIHREAPVYADSVDKHTLPTSPGVVKTPRKPQPAR